MRTVDLIIANATVKSSAPRKSNIWSMAIPSGQIPDYQMSAFLMAVYFSNMTEAEADVLTEIMMQSGEQIDLSDIPGIKVDKHSTGGVGDKTSLIAAPIAAAAGVIVPMISGRGSWSHRRNAGQTRIYSRLSYKSGCRRSSRPCLASTSSPLSVRRLHCTCDGKLYSLRDASATVESIPLIASSIMSKKLAAGLDALVLDVKVGRGAFMKRQVDARKLAQLMVGIGRRKDKRVVALITDMDQPLGFAIGNALEVMEVAQTLQNMGPDDLREISLELAARMIYLGKIAPRSNRLAVRRKNFLLTAKATASSRKSSRPRAANPGFSTSSSCFRTRRTFAKSPAQARDTSAASMLV